MVFTVSPEIEKSIADAIVHTEQGSYLALEPRLAKDIMQRIRRRDRIERRQQEPGSALLGQCPRCMSAS